MLVAGLDIGSRTIGLVEWNGSRVVREEVVLTGIDPLANSLALLAGRSYEHLVATGYGRHLAATHALAGEAITEIKAHALGALYLYPDARTIVDVGGQDSKVIRVLPDGRVERFEMNDRCAAGTGRFLENMAQTMGLSIAGFVEHALAAQGQAVRVSSMCTVFAESEVISLIGRGEDSRRVALGLHEAIATRLAAMLQRLGPQERLVFTGGGALNRCLKMLLESALGMPIVLPPNPQAVGALGAALHAAQRCGG